MCRTFSNCILSSSEHHGWEDAGTSQELPKIKGGFPEYFDLCQADTCDHPRQPHELHRVQPIFQHLDRSWLPCSQVTVESEHRVPPHLQHGILPLGVRPEGEGDSLFDLFHATTPALQQERVLCLPPYGSHGFLSAWIKGALLCEYERSYCLLCGQSHPTMHAHVEEDHLTPLFLRCGGWEREDRVSAFMTTPTRELLFLFFVCHKVQNVVKNVSRPLRQDARSFLQAFGDWMPSHPPPEDFSPQDPKWTALLRFGITGANNTIHCWQCSCNTDIIYTSWGEFRDHLSARGEGCQDVWKNDTNLRGSRDPPFYSYHAVVARDLLTKKALRAAAPADGPLFATMMTTLP